MSARQPFEERARRFPLPLQLHVGDPAVHVDERRPFAEDAIGNAHAVLGRDELDAGGLVCHHARSPTLAASCTKAWKSRSEWRAEGGGAGSGRSGGHWA